MKWSSISSLKSKTYRNYEYFIPGGGGGLRHTVTGDAVMTLGPYYYASGQLKDCLRTVNIDIVPSCDILFNERKKCVKYLI